MKYRLPLRSLSIIANAPKGLNIFRPGASVDRWIQHKRRTAGVSSCARFKIAD